MKQANTVSSLLLSFIIFFLPSSFKHIFPPTLAFQSFLPSFLQICLLFWFFKDQNTNISKTLPSSLLSWSLSLSNLHTLFLILSLSPFSPPSILSFFSYIIRTKHINLSTAFSSFLSFFNHFSVCISFLLILVAFPHPLCPCDVKLCSSTTVYSWV